MTSGFGTDDRNIERVQDPRERYGISYVNVLVATIEVFAPVVARLGGR